MSDAVKTCANAARSGTGQYSLPLSAAVMFLLRCQSDHHRQTQSKTTGSKSNAISIKAIAGRVLITAKESTR